MFPSFPVDIIKEIYSFLTPSELLNVSRLTHSTQIFVNEGPFWENLQKAYGIPSSIKKNSQTVIKMMRNIDQYVKNHFSSSVPQDVKGKFTSIPIKDLILPSPQVVAYKILLSPEEGKGFSINKVFFDKFSSDKDWFEIFKIFFYSGVKWEKGTIAKAFNLAQDKDEKEFLKKCLIQPGFRFNKPFNFEKQSLEEALSMPRTLNQSSFEQILERIDGNTQLIIEVLSYILKNECKIEINDLFGFFIIKFKDRPDDLISIFECLLAQGDIQLNLPMFFKCLKYIKNFQNIALWFKDHKIDQIPHENLQKVLDLEKGLSEKIVFLVEHGFIKDLSSIYTALHSKFPYAPLLEGGKEELQKTIKYLIKKDIQPPQEIASFIYAALSENPD